MNIQGQLDGIGETIEQKTARAIELLRTFEPNALQIDPKDGYYLAFSGGKDSVVIKELARMSGVKFKARYNQTTIDPPELIRFIKQSHADVEWTRPKRNFFKALEDSHGLPTRLNRWCCEEFKEQKSEGRVTILGVRAAESAVRARRWAPVTFWDGATIISPIVHWPDDDVWEFIHSSNLPYCSLYDEGWKRLGCVGCPIAGEHRKDEFARWPGFEKAWRIATRKYFDRRKGKLNNRGNQYYIERFKSGDEFFDWWLSDNPTPKDDEQQTCFNLSFGSDK